MVITESQIWQYLEQVKDPEIPVLSVIDLGVLRSVDITSAGSIRIVITPTYSGCPAMDTIRMDIRLKLIEHGLRNVEIIQSLTPAWTTNWISDEGKEKLRAYGIAPPGSLSAKREQALFEETKALCPLCGSSDTETISQFGSTACKSLHRCLSCSEAFDHFKCH